MDLLTFLLAVVAVGAVTGGIMWYLLKRPHSAKPRVRTKQPKKAEQSIDEIATSTKQRISRAQTMEEAFAAGREGLEKIKHQIKESKPPKPRRK